MRNFDVGIFPIFFNDLQGFWKNTICHGMQCILGRIIFGKDFFIWKINSLCKLYALLCW
jgi:hypothetical protein